MTKHVYDMIIVGGGPAGYSAALYGARANMDLLLIEKMYPGGQMTQTHQIDNYPGFADGIDGFSLAMQMQKQAEKFGAKTKFDEVINLNLKDDIKEVQTSNETYYAKTVVLAMGASPRTLGIKQEAELIGKGVAYCAACDGAFFRGKDVVVVGGGNTAVADALLLARLAKQVTLVHRKDQLRAEKILQQQLMDAQNIQIYWNHEVKDILHDDKVNGIVLQNNVTHEQTTLPADGIFVSIGRVPATSFLSDIALDAQGYIIANEDTKTSLDGVYAIGDIRTKPLRQVVGAVSDGAVAIHEAQQYLGK